MPTMKDVAEEADVSIATVSAVINKNKYVSDQLTKKVEEAIKKLNYSPNRIAQGLASQKTFVLAYLVPSISNLIFSEITEGMEKVASKKDYTITIVNTNFKIDKYYHDVRRLAHRVDGIMITAGHHPRINNLIEELVSDNIPTVIVTSPTNISKIPSILIDDIKSMENIINYLIDKGHQQIGFIGVKKSITSKRRWQGYKNGLEKNGIKYNPDFSIFLRQKSRSRGNYSINIGKKGCEKIISKTNISAIVTASDSIAIGAIRTLHRQNIRIPEDIAVIGYDDTVGNFTWPTLTTVKLPFKKMGELAAKKVLSKIERKNDKKEVDNNGDQELLTGKLIIRESS